MSYYVGLDVSVKSVSICVTEAHGAVIARGKVPSDPDQIAAVLVRHAPDAARILHENGILSIWLTRELEKRGLPIICIDARLAHKALSGRLKKSDRGDAEGLVHLARSGWFTQVHIRSETSECIRVLIGTRERLIEMRKDLEGHVRGVLKVFGICMLGVHRARKRSCCATHDSSGRISKCGDRDLWRLLYSAATILITQVKKPSPVLTWATRLNDRKGFKKAAVAAARRIAVIMHCIWRNDDIFNPNMEGMA